MGLFKEILKTIVNYESPVMNENQLKNFKQEIIKELSYNNPAIVELFRSAGFDLENGNRVTDAYRQVPTIYACIDRAASNLSSVPLRLYNLNNDEEITFGRWYDLFNCTFNPNLNGKEMIRWIATSLLSRGNYHIRISDESVKGVPSFFFCYLPDCWTPHYNNNLWDGWTLNRAGTQQRFKPEQVLHFRLQPYNDELLGLTPLEVLRMTMDTDWLGRKYNKDFFSKNAMPAFAYTTPNRLTTEQKNNIQRKNIDANKGEHHNGVILEGGLDVKAIGLSQKDMEFLLQLKFNREDILMIYHTPKVIVDLYEDVNFATAGEVRKEYWNGTLMPLGSNIEATFNRYLNKYGLYVAFDYSGIEVLQKALTEKIDAYVKLYNTGSFTGNELVEAFDLPFEPDPIRDEAKAPAVNPFDMGSVPQQDNNNQDNNKQDSPVTNSLTTKDSMLAPVREQRSDTRENLMEHYKKVDAVQRRCDSDLKDYFHGVYTKLLAKVTKAIRAIKNIDDEDINRAFDDEELQNLISVHIKDGMELGIDSIIKPNFTMQDPKAVLAFNHRVDKVKVVNQTAREKVQNSIRDYLKEATEQGLTEIDRAAGIKEVLKQDFKELRGHAQTIARTETHGAFSDARWEAAMSTQPTNKEWVTSNDEKVRVSHNDVDGEVVPINDMFSNGLHRPLDPNGAAEEVINCRCNAVFNWD